MPFLAIGIIIGWLIGVTMTLFQLRRMMILFTKEVLMDRATALQKGQQAQQDVDDAATRVVNSPDLADYQAFGDLFDTISGKAKTIAPAPPPAEGGDQTA